MSGFRLQDAGPPRAVMITGSIILVFVGFVRHGARRCFNKPQHRKEALMVKEIMIRNIVIIGCCALDFVWVTGTSVVTTALAA